MVALLITSLGPGSGKTTVCAGLGRYLVERGKKVAFFKPVIASSTPPAQESTNDAALMKHLLSLEEPTDLLCPVFGDENRLKSGIRDAYSRVAAGKDVVIIEGAAEPAPFADIIVETLDARVITVEPYSRDLPQAISSYQRFGRHLLGAVLNKVPRSRLERVRAEVSAQFSQAGIALFGILPEERTLVALTVSELAESIHGELLDGAPKSTALVESVMLGAMSVDSGPYYFGRQANKAVVVRSERPDMQLAALETSTTCLVLTGGKTPRPAVLEQAKAKRVPIILAQDSVASVVANIEAALAKTRFSPEKLPRLIELMERNFDFQLLYAKLGIAG